MSTILIGISLIILFAVSNAVAFHQGSKESPAFRKMVFYAVSAVEEGDVINNHLDDLRRQAQKFMDKHKETSPNYFIETHMSGSIIEMVISIRE